ncbi:MAG: Prochlorococcus phage, partial [Bacteroidota bacterium]
PGTHTFLQNGILGSNTGGSAILISSPSGVGTLFHKLWVDSKTNPNDKQEGKNGFFPIELPWTVHPERDNDWFEQQKAEIIAAKGERGIGMELLCSFASSGDTFLKGETMDSLLANIRSPESTQYYDKDQIWIWQPPNPNSKYVIGADVSRGNSDDYSAFHIIDINASEIVADYRGKTPPDKFAELLMTYGNLYNTALICQELNNVGVAAAIKLKESKYPNVFYEKVMKNMHMTYNPSDVANELPGFTTNMNTRVEMLAKLENALRNGKVLAYSKRLFEEFQTFIWKGNKPQAQKGYHDDMIMALAIALQMYEMSDASVNNPYESIENAMAMLKGLSRESTTLDSNTGKKNTQVIVANTDNVGPIAGEFHKMMEAIKKNKDEQKKIEAEKAKRKFYGPFNWLMED